MPEQSPITMTNDVYGHLFCGPAKDVDLMGEVERGLLAEQRDVICRASV